MAPETIRGKAEDTMQVGMVGSGRMGGTLTVLTVMRAQFGGLAEKCDEGAS
jgi:hypothetical protein